MDLIHNRRPRFTEAVIEAQALSSPFVLLDVGVYGGIAPRWRHLGTGLEVHGFDARKEAVAPLKREASPSKHYYEMAVGNEDGERSIFVAAEPAATSFYQPAASRYAVDERVERSAERRAVPIRRLDSLAAEGIISGGDFLKVDCEGFEPEVLRGAQRMIANGLLGAEIEASFNTSATIPEGHFEAISGQLLPHGFVLYDLAFNRVPCSRYVARVRELGFKKTVTQPRPATLNLLFCKNTPPSSADELLKRAIILELYGMADAAYDLLAENRTMLPAAVASDAMLDLLITKPTAPPIRLCRFLLRAAKRATGFAFAPRAPRS